MQASPTEEAIDYWITKTVTNQDLWVNVVGPHWRQSYWAWWSNQAGLHVSIKKGYPSVRKIGYRKSEGGATNEVGGASKQLPTDLSSGTRKF
jgi:hypothetical protein